MSMREKPFFIEVDSFAMKKEGEAVCGDCFISKKILPEHRIIAVLSDGLGSGIKANVLATMTASMAANLISRHESIERTAQTIMKTLPIDSERMMSYATFTIVDIHYDGETKVVEYGNPSSVIIRKGELYHPQRKTLKLDTDKADNMIYAYTFMASKEDRLVFFSDGVTQAGTGTRMSPLGWGQEAVQTYLCTLVQDKPYISANRLAKNLVYQAIQKDIHYPKDDTSCGVIYFREPRNLMVCTGPPFRREDDVFLASSLQEFEGKKIVCGGTTAEIITREFNKNSSPDVYTEARYTKNDQIDGIDLITEGILTLGNVAEILENKPEKIQLSNDAAFKMVQILLESDKISFIVGSKINEAHQDPTLPIQLEIRRNIVKKIRCLLEDKFLKEVDLKYI